MIYNLIMLFNIIMNNFSDISQSNNNSDLNSNSIETNSYIDSESENNSDSEYSLESDELSEEYNFNDYTDRELKNKLEQLKKLYNHEPKVPKICNFMENYFYIYSNCCNKKICCKLCHNIDENHIFDKINIDIICYNCGNKQKIGDYCLSCNQDFKTKYSCKLCSIYTNNNNLNYKHCESCNKCHLNIETNYCNDCNNCFFDNNIKHDCAKIIDNTCSICLNNLNSNIIITMLCGHNIHYSCYKILTEKDYKCPICRKSIKDMKDIFKKYDLLLKDKLDLNIGNNNLIEIYCNDCEKKSNSVSTYLGSKCFSCGSYNTV